MGLSSAHILFGKNEIASIQLNSFDFDSRVSLDYSNLLEFEYYDFKVLDFSEQKIKKRREKDKERIIFLLLWLNLN